MADLREAAERGFIGRGGEELARIAAGVAEGVAAVGQIGRTHIEDRRAFRREIEGRAIAAGAVLRGIRGRGRAVRRAHAHRHGELVAEAAVRLDRIDRDLQPVCDFASVHLEIRLVAAAHQSAHELRPEFPVARPRQPLRGPAALRVAGECARVAEPVAPRREQRLAALGGEQQLGGRLRLGRIVTEEQRRVRPVETRRNRVRLHRHGEEGLLDQARLRDLHRLGAENLRQRGRVAGEVKAPVAPLGERAQEGGVLVLLRAERDDRGGDLRREHRRREVQRAAAGARAVAHLARGLLLRIRRVGEEDDVLDARIHIAELEEGVGERCVDVNAASARGDG